MKGQTPASRSTILLAIAMVVVCFPASALAGTNRAHEGAFEVDGAGKVTVDQSNGDVYVVNDSGASSVSRFDSSGAPKNFTAGPDAGTNTLTYTQLCCGAGFSADVAVDNSGGPLDGTIYVGNPRGDSGAGSADPERKSVLVYARSGERIGQLTGSATQDEAFGPVCGVAVDQADGTLYVTSGSKVWRYAPSSPGGSVDDGDYEVTGISANASGCALAADSGNVYASSQISTFAIGELRRYSADSFASVVSDAEYSVVDSGWITGNGVSGVEVDPTTGDVHANEEDRVAVFDASGAPLYTYSPTAYIGPNSEGIALAAAASGPASKAYVTGLDQLNTFGAEEKVAVLSYPEISRIGPGGNGSGGAEPNPFENLGQLAFDQASDSLYSINASAPGLIYGFDAVDPTDVSGLSGFNPLETAALDFNSNLAVDNTDLSSAGNLYMTSSVTDLLYGFDASGTALGGAFPIDPESIPGTPDASPADLCGAAVDSAGNIWVANSATSKVLVYSASGTFVEAIDTDAVGSPCHIALNSANDLYAVIQGEGVWKFTAASNYASGNKILFTDRHQNATAVSVNSSTDDVYVAYRQKGARVDQYDSAGNFVAEIAARIPNKAASLATWFRGLAVDAETGNLYVGDSQHGVVRVFGPGIAAPEAAIRPASEITNTSVTLNGAAGNQAFEALDDCHFDYVSAAAFRDDAAAGNDGFSDLSSGGSVACDQVPGSIPLDLDLHPVSADVSGLSKDTEYRVRLSVSNSVGTTPSRPGAFFTASAPLVETVGSPIRTTTTVRLDARVHPKRAPTTFHFEYGTQGPCDSNPCTETPDRSAGDGNLIRLVSEQVTGLEPGSTYHYRVIADNGNPDGAAVGGDRTVTTRASDAPLTHGDFPGPPGSDRAWELVSASDTSGNPVFRGLGFASAGDRALYSVAGGIPQGTTGSLFGQFFAERPAGEHPTEGWQTRNVGPARKELVGSGWSFPGGAFDLSTFYALNGDRSLSRSGPRALFGMHAAAGPELMLDSAGLPGGAAIADRYLTDREGSRLIAHLEGAPDPAYPGASAANYYDVSSGAPELVSLLPGESVAACGAPRDNFTDPGVGLSGSTFSLPEARWLSTGGLFFFHSAGSSSCDSAPSQLYMRDIAAGESTRISPPALSGPDCGPAFLKSTPASVYFWSDSRLVAEDEEASDCAADSGDGNTGGDVYRYELAGESLECLTCVISRAGVEISTGSSRGPLSSIAIAADGSRLYFSSQARLLSGTPGGQRSIYRLNLTSEELAYVAPAARPGEQANEGGALTDDGRYLAFTSSASALNRFTGADNAATEQIYLYDDSERSLICVSCPRDGAPAAGAASAAEEAGVPVGPNLSFLAEDGTLAFAGPTALVAADQNTPAAGDPRTGTDVYEFRDGRPLLVTDGSSEFPADANVLPRVEGISPSGSDIFFTAAARYTPDAIDGIKRLYTARVGGGIDFPPASLPPCDLNAGGCEGPGTSAPDRPGAGSAVFSGPGNISEPFRPSCKPLVQRSRKLSAASRRLRKGSRRAVVLARRSSSRQARRVARRRAQRYVKASRRRAAAAKRQRRRAKRCRSANPANADRRADR